MLLNTSADWQTALARAVRDGTSPDANLFAPERLAVYVRLVRNNIFSFVNRCFTETQKHCSDDAWAQLLEDFVQNGEAHTPYFQEIADEFYQFCLQNQKLPSYLLDLMDLELAQLQVEVAIVDNAAMLPDEIHDDTNLFLSPSAQLRNYPEENTVYYQENELMAAGSIMIWRDTQDDVCWKSLNLIDSVLLGLLSQEPYSLNRILNELKSFLPDDDTWQQEILNIWQYWIEQGVLFAKAV
ncbi:DNA-binding domain-containing protein [Neisseriaceae bacterium B1]